jgi:hypothetical protein
MDQNEMVLRLACAILPDLMERRRENSYTDCGAIQEAFRLSQDWFCHQIEPTAKAVEAGATEAAGEPSAVQQLKPKMPSYDEVVNGVEASKVDSFKLSMYHYSGMRLCYDYIARHFGH